MPSGGAYTVAPSKNDDPLNGVSTLDLVAIQNHILGTQLLDSPYKLIAADVNRSGNISAQDMIELRKLILGIQDEFSNNSSWRMIDESMTFSDPSNPFSQEIKEEYDITSLNSNMNVDFVGVKIGDVNNSASANLLNHEIESRSGEIFKMFTEQKLWNQDQGIELNFNSPQAYNLEGFQMEIYVDPSLSSIQGFTPKVEGMNISNINFDLKDQGIIRISWNRILEVETKDLFSIQLNVHKQSWSDDLIQIRYENFNSEAYLNNQISDIELNFDLKETLGDQITLYQNTPNPWSEITDIKYYLPKPQEVILSLYNVNGALIYQEQKTAKAGVNITTLFKNEINQSGVLYYELIAGEQRMIQKMILLN